jgi:hypothetical protein
MDTPFSISQIHDKFLIDTLGSPIPFSIVIQCEEMIKRKTLDGKKPSISDIAKIVEFCKIRDRYKLELSKNPRRSDSSHDLALRLAANNNILGLEIMKASGHKFSVHCGSVACATGNLDLLKWLNASNCPLSYGNYLFAVICQNPRFDFNTFHSSILDLCGQYYIDHMNILQMTDESIRDNSHILDWLLQNKVPICCKSLVLKYCLCKNNHYGIQWLFKNISVSRSDCDEALQLAGIYAKPGSVGGMFFRLDQLTRQSLK